MIDFECTRKVFEIAEGGYAFQIVVQRDENNGWSASAFFRSLGMKDEAAALAKLNETVQKFSSMLSQVAAEKP